MACSEASIKREREAPRPFILEYGYGVCMDKRVGGGDLYVPEWYLCLDFPTERVSTQTTSGTPLGRVASGSVDIT